MVDEYFQLLEPVAHLLCSLRLQGLSNYVGPQGLQFLLPRASTRLRTLSLGGHFNHPCSRALVSALPSADAACSLETVSLQNAALSGTALRSLLRSCVRLRALSLLEFPQHSMASASTATWGPLDLHAGLVWGAADGLRSLELRQCPAGTLSVLCMLMHSGEALQHLSELGDQLRFSHDR